jgi:hypothetical protein
VLGTDVGCELLIALPFVVRLHLVDGLSNDRPQWVERPRAFGANPAMKILRFDPYQFATHRRHGHLAIWCGYASLKDGGALVFDGTAAAKTALFIALSEVLPRSPVFEPTSKLK